MWVKRLVPLIILINTLLKKIISEFSTCKYCFKTCNPESWCGAGEICDSDQEWRRDKHCKELVRAPVRAFASRWGWVWVSRTWKSGLHHKMVRNGYLSYSNSLQERQTKAGKYKKIMDWIVCCTNLTLFGGSEIQSEQYFVLICQGMIFNVFF